MHNSLHRDSTTAAADAAAADDGAAEETDHYVYSEGASGFRSGLAWGVSGFVIGAAFWHFVGFWGFVEKVVYNGRPTESSHYVAQSGPDCVALELDRDTRAVQRVGCDEDAPLLNEVTQSVRGDFLGARPAAMARGSSPIRLTSGER